jgi:peptidoglycan-associated lipoprotein
MGCGSSSVMNDESTLPSAARPAGDGDGSATSDRGNGSSTCGYEPVRFAYDSDALDTAARDVLQSNALCLRQRGTESADVVGMTDPRGTEEYNLALGERRAVSTRRFLAALGVAEARLSVRSVGEEMAAGQDEATWASDRRSELRTR